MTETIEKTMYLPADKETVWAYLTQPEKLARWFHAPKVPLAANAPYELCGTDSGDKLCWGDVEEMKPHDYMRWSFTVAPAAGHMSTVEWHLKSVPGGTRLSLVHTGLPEGTDGFGLLLALDKGWHDHLRQMRGACDEDLAAEQSAA